MDVYVVQEKLTDNMARHCFAVQYFPPSNTHSSAPIDHVHDDKRTHNEYEGNAEEMEHSHI